MTELIENHPLAELKVGDSASLTRNFTMDDVQTFALMSGDVNPSHVDAAFAAGDPFHNVVAHGMWSAALISNLLGTQLPGPGTVYLGQNLQFLKPVVLGDTVRVSVTVAAIDTPSGHSPRATLHCSVVNQRNDTVVQGDAQVLVPTEKISRPRVHLPRLELRDPGVKLHALVAQAQAIASGHAPLAMAVVHAVDAVSLGGAVDAAQAGLIAPVFVGPEAKIRAAAVAAGIDLGTYPIVATEHSHAAATKAVAMARAGEVQALMKGSLHSDELMHAVVDAGNGLRTARRISHVFVIDAVGQPRLQLLTDAAVNVTPDLEAKRGIVQNAIDLAHALGIAQPKVAILSAVETVNPKIPSTIDAAALCKMAERGQIQGGLLDGPLAFDNAVSRRAAQTKGIVSEVAGDADILVAPDLEAGNMLAKQLEYLAEAKVAGIVLGTRVPVVLTSRADLPEARLASCALAVLLALAAERTVAPSQNPLTSA
ncbi:MAG: bifunctional enoyl-CoA hydratase/phosphate acetyltransferase [Betaproteobacteria bacterium]|nr:bifunctional enoyl-CoA hydratase/phosphate acetyltransferase [Betaproteobacteria bacterium]MDE2122399.1 bifunctional enoyl-CoA hydratase/phosphate acetyltransferase [Betaproteobacteria bacterium]MDE2186251.1 bifunctional enoyl-CoA hydratase/phosphate acetyltransferase [Betaproteobacteria bacterium]MDE2325303.1 bifunctional enoyl-CoA hydratase/phosphate acetyltransferase [Betaproteobacteria bacterium]